MTVTWYVDNLKVSHKDAKVVTNFISDLYIFHVDDGLTVKRGKVHLLGCPHLHRGPHLRGSFTPLHVGEGPTRNQQPKITTHEPLFTVRPSST